MLVSRDYALELVAKRLQPKTTYHSLHDILQAIETSTKTAVESKIDTLQEDLGLLRADHRKLASIRVYPQIQGH